MNNMYTRANKNSGFTLVELMIVIGILSIMSGVMLAAFVAMLNQSQYTNAKIKMRNEARLGMDYMLSNLRMAKLTRDRDLDDPDDPILRYEDEFGDLQGWPPPEIGGGSAFSEPVNSITFVRPLDSGVGSPFVAGTPQINWSELVTFKLDVDDENGDGRTDQVIQLIDGEFTRVIIGDISPVVNSGNNSIYDTPATGGLAFQGSAANGDETKVYVTLIQRRDIGSRRNAIVTRYDSYVDVQN